MKGPAPASLRKQAVVDQRGPPPLRPAPLLGSPGLGGAGCAGLGGAGCTGLGTGAGAGLATGPGIGRATGPGIGRSMPLTLLAFTFASLSLIGIPPFAGFVSKWYLAEGALSSGIRVISWLGPVILLVSALLTAAYLLPVTVAGFFPGKDFKGEERNKEGGALMIVPLLCLAILTVLLGIFSGQLNSLFESGFAALF